MHVSNHSTRKLTAGAVMVTALFMGSPGHAEDGPIPHSAEVKLGCRPIYSPGCAPTGVETPGLAVRVNNAQVVNVPKVSEPFLLIRATSEKSTPRVVQTAHAKGENDCQVTDNPTSGKLNRSIVVHVEVGATTVVYARLSYFTTNVATGETNEHPLEPFGDKGTTITAPSESKEVPIQICAG